MELDANLHVGTMDISLVFLYAPIEEELYIVHPNNRRTATPLNKALDGLKHPPKNWNDTSRQFLKKYNFYDTEHAPGLFISKDEEKIIAAYVDDTLIAAKNEEEIDKIIRMFQKSFDLKIIGIMNDRRLRTDILGLDLDYDLNKVVATLSLDLTLKLWKLAIQRLKK